MRIVEMTATGSVAETMAPTRNAELSGIATARFRTIATKPAMIRTPGTARSDEAASVGRTCAMSSLKAASKTRPGTSTMRTSSGVTSMASGGARMATSSPTTTSAAVYGTARRRLTRATRARATSNATTTSARAMVSAPVIGGL